MRFTLDRLAKKIVSKEEKGGFATKFREMAENICTKSSEQPEGFDLFKFLATEHHDQVSQFLKTFQTFSKNGYRLQEGYYKVLSNKKQ